MRDSRSRPGWTLIELLVVIGVLAILLGLTLPAIMRARETASLARCRHNLGQLALAAHAYDEALGHLPPYATGQPGTAVRGGWWVYLMSYAEQEPLHKKILDAAKPTSFGTGTFAERAIRKAGIRNAPFPMLLCRSDPSRVPPGDDRTMTNYVANWYVFGNGAGGCYTPAQRLTNIKDGLSNTVLFAEAYRYCGGVPRPALDACCYHNFGITWDGKPSDDPSYAPKDFTLFQMSPREAGGVVCDPLRSQTAHSVMPAALADGSVQSIVPGINPSTWRQLVKPNDGGPVDGNW